MLEIPSRSAAKQNLEFAAEAAEEGLRHVSDSDPGIRRRKAGRGFTYAKDRGAPVSETDMARIRSLVIPPAWTDVWICTSPKGHIQATGRDEKGRKQYRYHPLWTTCRGETKFSSLVEFGQILTPLRRKMEADMRGRALSFEKVAATVVWLLDNVLIRVGNASYARDNKSFGLTTLRNRHIKVDGGTVKFVFTGKSGKNWNVGVTDRRIARIVRSIQELPGQHLFQYVGEDGERRAVTSHDINAYVREATGASFTSKHFRTWGGTVYALEGLRAAELPDSKKATKRVLNAEIDKVASLLGNTRSVCRSCYIHPRLFQSWEKGSLKDELKAARSVRITAPGLDDDERLALKWLTLTSSDR